MQSFGERETWHSGIHGLPKTTSYCVEPSKASVIAQHNISRPNRLSVI